MHHAEFDVYIRNYADPIKVRLAWKFLANPTTHTKKKANRLLEVYDKLCRETFVFRSQRYLEQMRMNGYFVYDSKRFTRDGQMLSNSGKYIIDLAKARLLRHPFYIECQLDEGIHSWAARMLAGRTYKIKTYYDSDVLFALLGELYHIQWS